MTKKKKGVKKVEPHMVIIYVHNEVYMELQYRFPALYNLSGKTKHKLLDEISQIIAGRLKRIAEVPGSIETCYKLSQLYRSNHPHSTDLQLVQTTLHKLQDASGAPRLQLDAEELMHAEDPTAIENVPLDKVKRACKQFNDRISQAITAHVASLDTEIAPADTEEDIARKKVREELKKMMTYMPAALKQIISSNFIPQELPYRRIRIYGEPFLPGRDAMHPFTKRYHAVGSRFIRSQRMYNLLMFKINAAQYPALRAMDATVINGSKLTIRSDIPLREVSTAVRKDLATFFGGSLRDTETMMDEDDEDLEDFGDIQDRIGTRPRPRRSGKKLGGFLF